MNYRISDHTDYLNALRHEFNISTGARQAEIRKEIFKAIAEQIDAKKKPIIPTDSEDYERACMDARDQLAEQRSERDYQESWYRTTGY